MCTYDKEVNEILKDCGIPQHLSGYRYLTVAIPLTLEDPSLLNSVTKILYPKIADICNSTSNKVERAIRHAIEVGFDNICHKPNYKIFGNSINAKKGKPTNSHFIYAIKEYLTKEYLSREK